MRAFKKTENKFLRIILIVAGILFVFLGIMGIIFPIIPATPFFLVSAWCFMKTSDRLYHWLMFNRLFGHHLKNYLDGNGIALGVKIFLLTMAWLMISYLIFFVFAQKIIYVILVAVAIAISITILREKTYRSK